MRDRSPEQRGTVGAFMGPSGTFPAAMHTLSDEIPGEPTELEAEKRSPARAGKELDSLRDRIRRRLRRTSR